MLRQVVTWKSLTCYVKLVVLTRELHVMQREMGGVRTDVTCYVRPFVLTE